MKVLFTLLLISASLITNAQKISKLSIASDSTYGYTIDNPMQIKLGNTGKSYDYFTNLLDNLTTSDGQSLLFIKRITVANPHYRGRKFFPRRNLQQDIFKKSRYGVSGQMKQFQYLTERSKDTLKLYVDFDKNNTIKIPRGLQLKSL
jgi:hypothetical protein